MPSPIDAVRRLSASSLALLLTRAQFAAVELAQARAQFVRWLVLALLATMLALLTLMAASAVLVIVLWESAGPLTLLGLALLYAAGGFAFYRRLQREVNEAPPLLSETLTELAQDRDAILGRAASESASSTNPSASSAPR